MSELLILGRTKAEWSEFAGTLIWWITAFVAAGIGFGIVTACISFAIKWAGD